MFKNALMLSAGAAIAALGIQAQTSDNPARPQAPARQAQERAVQANRPPSRPVEPITSEQREKIRVIMEKTREEQRESGEKLREARRELEQATQADEINEPLIREKAAVVGRLEGDMALIRARQYQEMRQVLPRDQAARFRGVPPAALGNRPPEVRRRGGTNAPSAPIQRPAAVPAESESPSPK